MSPSGSCLGDLAYLDLIHHIFVLGVVIFTISF